MTYLFAAYSVVFLIIFMYMTVQGKRLNKLAYDMDHLSEMKQALENDRIQQKVNSN